MKLFQKVSDWAALSFGSPWFFAVHLLWWGSWILIPVEPFPFGLLTLIVSLESILLSGLILNATNRSGEADRRIIAKDLKLDQATHNHVETILRKVEEIHDAVQTSRIRPKSDGSGKRGWISRMEGE
jgi:uncharacterized membrane protein